MKGKKENAVGNEEDDINSISKENKDKEDYPPRSIIIGNYSISIKIIISPGFHIDINIKVYVIIFTMIIDEENLNKIINESSEPIKYGKF